MISSSRWLCAGKLANCRAVACSELRTECESRVLKHLGRHRWNLASYLLGDQNRAFRIRMYLELYRCSVLTPSSSSSSSMLFSSPSSPFRLSRCIALTAYVRTYTWSRCRDLHMQFGSDIMPSIITASSHDHHPSS